METLIYNIIAESQYPTETYESDCQENYVHNRDEVSFFGGKLVVSPICVNEYGSRFDTQGDIVEIDISTHPRLEEIQKYFNTYGYLDIE